MHYVREIVFDTETTGLNPKNPEKPDRIVEIGCVEIVGFERTGREFHAYLNPDRDVPEEVVKVHGLTGDFLARQRRFAEVVDEFLAFIGDSRLVAHNAAFDRDFINMELERLGRTPIAHDRFLCTRELAKASPKVVPPGTRLSLDALASHFKLDQQTLQMRKGKGGHGAVLDSQILAQVYLALNGGAQRSLAILDELQQTAAASAAAWDMPRRQARPEALAPLATDEELAAHDAFVTTLGPDALWKKPKESALG